MERKWEALPDARDWEIKRLTERLEVAADGLRERDAEIERLREEVDVLRKDMEKLRDHFQNGVRHNEKRNVYELVWTERQLEKAKKEAERILAALAPKELKP